MTHQRPLHRHLGGKRDQEPDRLIGHIEKLIRRDPARRGLIGSEARHGPLCPGHLATAADHLAENASTVGIVTGFFVPDGRPPAAETDGPLGAVLLASALKACGVEVVLLTDTFCRDALQAAAEAAGLPIEMILSRGQEDDPSGAFWNRLADTPLSHLIAVERAGPNHTPESLRGQRRCEPPPLSDYLNAVPPDCQDRPHNVRGAVIDACTADLHRLFEELPQRIPNARSIGIGDGGNELGMGTIPWEELYRRLETPRAGRIPCRIATDWTLIAGTSNWGATALAAAFLLLRDRLEVMAPWNRDYQFAILEDMVAKGPAVDGVTGRQEPTVDGLPFLTYIQIPQAIRRLLGLPE